MSKHNEFNRNFAVIIGINNYQNSIRELKTAVPDALKLAQIIQKQHENLKPQYQKQNRYEVQLFLNQRASLSQLKRLIADFKQGQIILDNEKVTVTEDDRLLFYFAGHGIALDALENQEGPVGYLIPQDATSGDSSTYLPMQELHDALNALPCRHMLAILDCCFAGAFRWASLRREIVPKVKVYKERYDRFISDAAWQVITSAADDQKALDSLGSRGIVTDGNEVHSPFAKALFDALRGEGADLNKDGIITATELYSYLRDQVEILTEKHYQRQTPSLCPLRKHGKGEFIFLSSEFDRDKLEDAPPLNVENNPYKGLQSYDEKDRNLFFGREEQIQKLFRKIVANNQPLTLVLGASGTGKSSLMKAGLLPRLRHSQKHLFQILDPMRPGESPLKSLAQIFLPITNTITAEKLAKDEQALANNIERWSQNNPKTKVLLAIDQFEELITLCKSAKEREQFQKLIKNTITNYPNKIHVVITLRLDFEAQFQTFVLKDFWNEDTRFVVPPMSQNEFREAIEKPASEKVVYFDPPSLVDELINEVVQMPGALPLLSFTLSELYLKYLGDRMRDNRALTKKDYEELGRVVGSLTKRANNEHERLVAEDPAYKDTVRRVMLRMISLQGAELARRQVPKSELMYPVREENKRVQTVIKRFSEARLIVQGSNSQGEPYVEPAHDALVQGWDKLLAWKKQEEENLILQRRLTPAAEEWNNVKDKEKQPNSLMKTWEQAESFAIGEIQTWRRRNWQRKKREQINISKVSSVKSIAYLWDDDPRIEQLNQLLDSDDSWLNWSEDKFVRRSVLQRNKNTYRLSMIVTGVILGLSALSIIATIGQRNAEIGLIGNFRSSAEQRFLLHQELEAFIEVLQAGIKLKHPLLQIFKPDNQLQNQVIGTLHKAVYGIREYNRIVGHKEFVKSVSFSPSGTIFATGGSDRTARLWDLSGKELAKFEGHTQVVTSVSFSPDGKQLATASADGTICLWDLSTKQQVAKFEGYGVSFSPDGKQLAIGTKDGNVRLLDLQTKLQIAKLEAHISSVNSVSFSPNGSRIAVAGSNGNVSLWDLKTKLQVAKFEGHINRVNSISFSPDGTKLVSAGEDRTVRLWDLQTKQEVAKFEHLYSVESVSFNPQGTRLATTTGGILTTDYEGSDYDGTVYLWDLNNTKQPLMEFKGHKDYVNSVSFSPDGKLLATASDDSTARLWDLSSKELVNFEGHKKSVISISFSPDGKLLATASDDGTTRLWDLSAKELAKFEEPIGKPTSVSFSPDGKQLAIAYNRGSVSLWDLKGKQQVAKFEGNKKSVTSVSFSPDGSRIAVAGSDSTVSLWDLKTKQQVAQIKVNIEVNITWQLHSISFSPDGKQLAIASADGNAYLWDLKTKQQVAKFEEPIGVVTSVSFSPDGKLLATAGFDNVTRLWDLKTKQKVTQFGGRLDPSDKVSFSPDGKLLATAGTNGNFQLWDLQTKQQVARFEAHEEWVTSISFSPDGKLIATAGWDNVVRLWAIEELDDLLSKGCNWVRDYLKNNPNVSESDRHLCDDLPPTAVNLNK